jgi:hypothetical protein
MAKWLAILLHLWEVLGSKFSPKTSYPEVFCGLPQSLKANATIQPQIKLWLLPSMAFPIHYSLIIIYFDTI